jgi:hypothetical protein
MILLFCFKKIKENVDAKNADNNRIMAAKVQIPPVKPMAMNESNDHDKTNGDDNG